MTVDKQAKSKARFAGVPLFSRAFIKWTKELLKYLTQSVTLKNCNIDDLINSHFKIWSTLNHENVGNFRFVLNQLPNDALIVETGTAAWGIASSRLFDGYVARFGGEFYSVDIRKEASQWLKFQYSSQKTHFAVSDSVSYLRWELPEKIKRPIDLVYLDSMDFNLARPLECAEHALAEFLSLEYLLKPGSLVLIDDSPNSFSAYQNEHLSSVQNFRAKFGTFPGKGALIEKYVLNNQNKFEILFHNYQLCVKVR